MNDFDALPILREGMPPNIMPNGQVLRSPPALVEKNVRTDGGITIHRGMDVTTLKAVVNNLDYQRKINSPEWKAVAEARA